MALGSRSPDREFLLRACAILVHGDAILVEETDDEAGGHVTSLPGGHVEFGESSAAALSRELYEETGLHVEADRLVYVHENFYRHRGVDTHEIGLYFLGDLASGFPTPDARGYLPHRQAHLRLRLLPLDGLADGRLMPRFLRDVLPDDVRRSFDGPTRHVVTREG